MIGSSTSNSVLFNFGSIGPAGFIAIIGVIVGIVALAGITVFGTGAGTESVHILFMGGLLLGIWFFLTGLDGTLSGNSKSLFNQLNVSFISMGQSFGTELYVLLTFLYLVGFAGMVKRGI